MPEANKSDIMNVYRIWTVSGNCYSVLSEIKNCKAVWDAILQMRVEKDPIFYYMTMTVDNKLKESGTDSNFIHTVEDMKEEISLKSWTESNLVVGSKKVFPVKISELDRATIKDAAQRAGKRD